MIAPLEARKSKKITVGDPQSFIQQALYWGSAFQHLAYFTGNDLSYPYETFPHFLAVGARKLICKDEPTAFEALKAFYPSMNDWAVGYLGYDLKNETEDLKSGNPDRTGFPDLQFFQPETLLFFNEKEVIIETYGDPENIYSQIKAIAKAPYRPVSIEKLKSNLSKSEYLNIISRIKQQIAEGEVYEMNFCMEFFSKNAVFDPVDVFLRLNALSPMPFATFQKFSEGYLMSASPERFLKKKEDLIISQPIKGTARRGKNKTEDEKLRKELLYSEKERAENLMIVDLVRNDLAKSAVLGTVKVDELFGIYSYSKIHQMVSTVSAKANPELNFVDIIKNAYPMGSMTGAPKVSAMKLIENYENSRRGLFSGAAGFIKPNGDFDFNVVIRSLIYNSKTKTISFHVGSAITYDSDPEKEYQECLLKASAIMQVLGLSS